MKENYIGQIGIWGKRYKHLLSLMGRNRDELSETLTDKQIETLEKYDDAVSSSEKQ